LLFPPAGLENYFKEVASILQTSEITWELEQEIANHYGQEFLDNLDHWGTIIARELQDLKAITILSLLFLYVVMLLFYL